jgi:hypothetical protein
MSYRCRICGETTGSAWGMAEHMLRTTHRAEEHQKWIKEHGITPSTAPGQPEAALIHLVEKECRKQETRRG